MDLLSSKLLAMGLLTVLTLIFGLSPLKLHRRFMKTSDDPDAQKQQARKKKRDLIVSCLLCFGAGVLMATVFIHMLPETRETIASANAATKKEGLDNAKDHDGHETAPLMDSGNGNRIHGKDGHEHGDHVHKLNSEKEHGTMASPGLSRIFENVHDHEHHHPDGESSDHDHPHEANSIDNHDHAHGTDSANDHDHAHGTDSGHDHDHALGTDSAHDHDHALGTDSAHDHDHAHSTDSGLDNDHAHGADSAHDHAHGTDSAHDHAHGTDSAHDHDHAHGTNSAHDHAHGTDSGHDHDHAHGTDSGHDHDHAHSTDSTHDHDHAHEVTTIQNLPHENHSDHDSVLEVAHNHPHEEHDAHTNENSSSLQGTETGSNISAAETTISPVALEDAEKASIVVRRRRNAEEAPQNTNKQANELENHDHDEDAHEHHHGPEDHEHSQGDHFHAHGSHGHGASADPNHDLSDQEPSHLTSSKLGHESGSQSSPLKMVLPIDHDKHPHFHRGENEEHAEEHAHDESVSKINLHDHDHSEHMKDHDHIHGQDHSHGHDHHGHHDHHSHGDGIHYPIAELLNCIGFFFVYFVEEFVHKVGSYFFLLQNKSPSLRHLMFHINFVTVNEILFCILYQERFLI